MPPIITRLRNMPTESQHLQPRKHSAEPIVCKRLQLKRGLMARGNKCRPHPCHSISGSRCLHLIEPVVVAASGWLDSLSLRCLSSCLLLIHFW
jgi:hypothetical protein